MNIVRNIFAEEIQELKPLLRNAYKRIEEYQLHRDERNEARMREAIAATLPVLVKFKPHIPAYKRRYLEVLEEGEKLVPYDLIICFDRGIYELHTRLENGNWKAMPWSQELRELLNERQAVEEKPEVDAAAFDGAEEEFLTSGNGASRGTVTGRARIVRRRADLVHVQPGEILVTPMTTPDFIEVVERIVGIVTDRGGAVCHAAILAREFNKPCIVGCGNATELIQDGQWIRMDATSGIVMGVAGRGGHAS